MPSKAYHHPEERPLRDAACGGSSGQAGASRSTHDAPMQYDGLTHGQRLR